MEESNKEKIYNKLLQIAEKYKATEQSPWNNMAEEDIVRTLMHITPESIATALNEEGIEKEDNDPLCLNLTTIDSPHHGGA